MANPTASVHIDGDEEALAPLISSLIVVFIVLLSLLVTSVAAILVYYILVRYILGGSADDEYIPVRGDEQSDVDTAYGGGHMVKTACVIHSNPIIYRPCTIQKEKPSQKLDISSVRLLLSYIEDLSGNKNRIDEDWKALEKYGKELPPTKVSGNESLWSPVSIYDRSHHKPDYIVASHPGCASDLWELVARKGVTTIVVLGNLKSNVKYWVNSSKKYGRFKVQLVSEHHHGCYVIRSFFIQETEGKRFSSTITQCHFLNWPHPVKSSSPTIKSLLSFRRKVNQAVSSPLLIHCSDGISHTGAYCLIDVVLNRICRGGAREVNLSATLEHLRDQKPGLVTTKEQYEMAIAAIVEETQSLLND
ncbi:receptor-type tyrosine-protein phosphatase N2-like [Dysidea avara]|uniref:receptor-type tyrosine-protein phosphatase N2-like n=1 Tax=Dysidea avara TaxID=196820 RepID=UPI003328210F